MDLFSSLPNLANQAINSKFLLSVYFEKNFEKDFEEFKNEIGINWIHIKLKCIFIIFCPLLT